MPEFDSIFEHSRCFDPAADFEAFLKDLPARWVVYLMVDAEDRPVQLLCVKNLRSSLKRRLGGEETTLGLSRRVNYREIVRRVYWRRVDSALEADWLYLEAARTLFPKSYQGMVGFRPAWFVHVDPAEPFPRWTKTPKVEHSGLFIGPIEDKHAAHRLIELVEDAFDLCRYYNVLIEAPRGKACAYKEMGRCAAPCDGTVGMDHYRKSIEQSINAVVEHRQFLRDLDAQMRRAAKELEFESAKRIKQRIDRLSELGKGPFRHARPIQDFRYLSLQRGPRDGTAKVFLIVGGRFEELAGLVENPVGPADLLRHALTRAEALSLNPLDPEGVERLGLVSHHLFLARQIHGVFLPLDAADEKSLAKAWRDLKKQKVTPDADGEGVLKELQAMGDPEAEAPSQVR